MMDPLVAFCVSLERQTRILITNLNQFLLDTRFLYESCQLMFTVADSEIFLLSHCVLLLQSISILFQARPCVDPKLFVEHI